MSYGWLHDDAIRQFIRQYDARKIDKLLLSQQVFPAVSNSLLVQQIIGRKIAEKKFPFLLGHDAIIYPPRLNLEQSSSEIAARYKASLISGQHIVDISCGFGIDSMFFAGSFQNLSINEPNTELLQMVVHNLVVLGIPLMSHTSVPAEQLRLPEVVDWWYADPSRRNYNKRTFLPWECAPALDRFISIHPNTNFMVKYSPMLDIHLARKYLGRSTEVHIVSVDGECKELLFIQRLKNCEDTLFAVELSYDGQHQVYPLPFDDYPSHEINYGVTGRYLYEPGPSAMKAGAFNYLAQHYSLAKLDVHTHLFSSDNIEPNFPGNIYEIMQIHRGGIRSLHLPTTKLHVKVRNYPATAEALTKQLGVLPDGDWYLFACTEFKNKKVLITTRKLQPAPKKM